MIDVFYEVRDEGGRNSIGFLFLARRSGARESLIFAPVSSLNGPWNVPRSHSPVSCLCDCNLAEALVIYD
jgi:hypothetical protein